MTENFPKQRPMRENSQNSAGSTSQLNFNSWTVEQVGNWLSNNDFGEYRQQFAEHNITGDLLLQLNYTWLKDVGVIVVGDRARILQAIQRQFLKYNQDAAKTVTYASKIDRSDNSIADANTKAENRKGLLPPPNDKSPRSSAIHRSNHGGHRKYASDDKLDMRSSRFDRNNESSIETTPRQMRKASTEKANPIQIYPRTSSRKESNSNKQLNEAYDVIFGSSSPKSAAAHPTPPLSGSSPRLATQPVQAIISSPKPPSGRVSKTSVKSPKSTETPTLLERDVMKMKFIREKCIRVTGDDNQGHVVTVEGLKSGADIRKKVLSKFGISTDATEWIIATFSPPNSKLN